MAFLSSYKGEALSHESVLEAGGGSGSLEVMDCFQKALDSANMELEHDVMGCSDCWVNGDIVYCAQSRFHLNHHYHKCPSFQSCYCLAPEIGGLSKYPDHMCC